MTLINSRFLGLHLTLPYSFANFLYSLFCVEFHFVGRQLEINLHLLGVSLALEIGSGFKE